VPRQHFFDLTVKHTISASGEEMYLFDGYGMVGIGLSFAAMATLIVDAVPQSQTGVATDMNTIMRSVGGALGAQISASIVGAQSVPPGCRPRRASSSPAGALALAFVAALLIRRRQREPVVPHGYERLGEPARVGAR
jgi:MYXO-CTERM domain-containing protein